MTAEHSKLDIENSVREVAGLQPDNIPAEVLNSAEPLILKGFVDCWPMVQAAKSGRTEVLSYLQRFCKNQEILVFKGEPEIKGRFFYNDEMSGFNFGRVNSSFEFMLSLFESLTGAEDEPAYYIGSTAVDLALPGLRAENDIGLAAQQPLVSIWMGNRTRIAAHFDNPRNIACIGAGRRRFTLFPPEQLANLYVGPLDFTPAGQAISLVDFEQPDFERFPLFKEALKNAQVAELDAGDALYLPSLWWHHVEALETFNVLVNYWWRDDPAAVGTPMDVLIHALLNMQGLTAGQKRAWKNLFEHYVFDDQPEAFAHIPDARLGILGDIDATTARQLRTMLRSKLDK
ncbi:MAG: cupin-like domain-containing protein [Halieaceae bacterium]